MTSIKTELVTGKLFTSGIIRGVGLAVINPSGELWIQRDKQDKAFTDRRAGDLSIIFETRKRRKRMPGQESHRRNILGALPELVDDETLPMVQDDLLTTDRLRSTPVLSFTASSGTVINYVVAVGILAGQSDAFNPTPYDSEETEPVGWMSPDEFLGNTNVRPVARQAVAFLQENGIIEEKLAQYDNPLSPKRHIVPRRFSVSEFYRQRERGHDMVPGKIYSVS